ncbi:MAG: carboxypeptidase regulatory-like domain-containing protein [Thermoanaerobaculaceae bacterium]
MRKIGVLVALLGVLGWWVVPAIAAESQPFKPQVFHPVKFDVSKPLRDVKVGKPAEMGKPREVVNRAIPKVQPGAGGKYDTLQNAPGRQVTPNPLLTFQGLDSDDNANVLGFRLMPPDTEGDVSPNHYFEWVNLVFQIYDKTGAPQLPNPLPGNAFWSGFGGPCETDNDGDPIVLYDHLADRWFVQQFSSSTPYRLCAAVSTSNDPTDTYYRYEYVFNNNKFPDYPKVGLWPDAYYVGFNQFLNLQSWSGAGALAYEREAMIAGSPTAQVVYFDLYSVNPDFGNMFPADLDGQAPPPGTPGIFVEWDDASWMGDPTDTLRIWYFNVDWTNPANSTFGLNGQPNELIPTADIDPNMCNFNRNCIPQMGTTQRLDAISDRLMYRIVFRDFGTYQTLLTAQTVDADGTDHAGVHWRELHSGGTYTGYSVFQEGTYAPDAHHRWMPSVNMDATGNICVAYSISSSSIYPSAGYACREAGDPLGQLGNEVIYRPGTGYQSGGERWGDYSTVSVDPTDQCTFWTAQEFGRASGSFYWSTAVASFKMPNCVSGPSGTVHGTVTSNATGSPLAGVQVQAVGTNTYSTSTNNSGQYSLALPPDTYDITFSKFGYTSFTQQGVVVNDGDDITLDVALNPVGNAELDGYVTGQAHGWPLYAKVVAKVGGTTMGETYTNPFNGYYCFCAPNDLPQGYTYTLEVTSQIPGYLPATDTLLLPPTGTTKNFVLADDNSANWIFCVLSGGLNENFEGDFPPPGWHVEVYNNNTNNNWRRNDQWGRANPVPGGSGYAAGADSVKAGSGSGLFDTALVTPWIQMPATTRELAFNHNFNAWYATDRGYVDICVSPCSSWTNLVTFSSDNQQPQTISLAGYEGKTIKLRFRYVSGKWAYWWYIDDVRTQIPAVPPPPPTSQWVENFDGATPPNLPTNWAYVVVSGSSNSKWATATATVHPSGQSPHSTPNLAYFNSWSVSSGSQARLYKTTLDTIPSGQAGFVGFWLYHDTGYSGSADRVQVQYSTDGVTWNNAGAAINRYDGSTGWKYHLVELTGASGSIYVGLLGISAYGNDVHIDDVEFLLGTGGTPPIPDTPSFNCSPVPGTLVEGLVTDQNTGLPVLGATVTNNETGNSGTSAATPDPNLAEGFYWLFVPQPGYGPATRTFTATKTGYGPANASAVLPPNTVYRIDFALPAGWLVVSPTSLFSRLYTGQSETQYLTLENQGGVPVNYSLFVLPQANTWPHYSPVVSGHVPHTPASIDRAPSIQQPNYGKFEAPYLVSVEAYGIDLSNKLLLNWPDITVPGTATTVGPDTNNDFAGDFVLGDFSKLYVLDFTNNQLAYLDTSTGARTIVGSATPSGGHQWTGMAASPTGTIYASATDCSSSTLYTIDKNTGAATLIGTITNTPCAINLAIDPAGQWLYAVDIVNNNLVKIDPSTAAGTIVGSVGIDASYAQGMDFDDLTGTLYWASFNFTSSSGELRVIDTTTGASTLVGAFPGGAEIDALAIKTFSGGVCWLTLNPGTGAVPANSQVTVNADFQATNSCPPLYGSYRATISVVNDTAYPVTNPTVCFYRAFNDIPQGHMFDKFIHGLAGGGITQGFAGNFDPATYIQRHVMARWLLKARYGSNYAPPSCIGIFADVDCENTPNADFIEDVYNKGISGGCSTNPLKFCPNDPVKRNQMAVFLLRAKAPNPTTYTPPACTSIFSDVTCPGPFANWIEELYHQGITSGCGGNNYCPADFVRRDQMSKFVVTTFSIPTCP